MSLNRRQILRGSLAAGAMTLPLGAPAAPAYGVVREPRAQAPQAGFSLALLDVNNQIITNHHTRDIRDGKFGKPWATFRTGQGSEAWDPLELKFRKLQSGEAAFLVCDGNRTEGHVTIHRNSDAAPLGWVNGLTNFPHSLEYLPTADVIVVVGTQGLDSLDPKPPEAGRSGGCYELYLAPTGESTGPLQKIHVRDEDRAFRQAHGVVWDETKQFLWIFGGNKIRAASSARPRAATGTPSPAVRTPDPE
ncbi:MULTISPECIES: twin-arginine translocation signal domain-containing protein [Streptomyces]|uniref:twin-arginine translocation signal domain-containing protein n=1 Tax=Streptomyces TaxID=1883 RepID=UPI00345BCF6B